MNWLQRLFRGYDLPRFWVAPHPTDQLRRYEVRGTGRGLFNVEIDEIVLIRFARYADADRLATRLNQIAHAQEREIREHYARQNWEGEAALREQFSMDLAALNKAVPFTAKIDPVSCPKDATTYERGLKTRGEARAAGLTYWVEGPKASGGFALMRHDALWGCSDVVRTYTRRYNAQHRADKLNATETKVRQTSSEEWAEKMGLFTMTAEPFDPLVKADWNRTNIPAAFIPGTIFDIEPSEKGLGFWVMRNGVKWGTGPFQLQRAAEAYRDALQALVRSE